jgi:predicted nucleotidyltransferase component of viral defense system
LIPKSHIQAWKSNAPWPLENQVEQDLIISRALCDLFSEPALKGKVAFRGGTAINKLLFDRPLRYSEDIDLVQILPEPIGKTVDAIRDALFWLGPCRREQAGHSMHLIFKFVPEDESQSSLKLKVEINTREHESLFGIQQYGFAMDNPWHKAKVDVASYTQEEMFATKLRALLQRRKNRDLFDLHHGLQQLKMDPAKIVMCFGHYMSLDNNSISRAIAEKTMLKKLEHSLSEDVSPLLPPGISFTEDEAIRSFEEVWRTLIARIDGDPWKLTDKVVQELREKRYPDLLLDNYSPADAKVTAGISIRLPKPSPYD